jgi:hypothetical protein
MVGANFVPLDFGLLLVWIGLWFLEPFQPRRWNTNVAVNADVGDGGRVLFGIVWAITKALGVVATFTYVYYSIDYTHVAFQTVPSLIIANVLLSKLWPALFFTLDARNSAFCLAVVLCATSITACVLMGIYHENLGRLYPVPLAIYSLCTLGLLFATGLNFRYADITGRCTVRYKRRTAHRATSDDEIRDRHDKHRTASKRRSHNDNDSIESELVSDDVIRQQVVHQTPRYDE